MLPLRPAAGVSAPARAEVVSWRAGAALRAVVAVGGVVAIGLTTTGSPQLAGLVDPILVLIACAGIAPMVVGLVREGVRELLEASPDEALRGRIAGRGGRRPG